MPIQPKWSVRSAGSIEVTGSPAARPIEYAHGASPSIRVSDRGRQRLTSTYSTNVSR
jgi:hypothetical protein